jgi:hypothetical protein
MAKNTGYSSVSKDIQDIANLGLDRDYNVPMVIAYVHNPVTDELDRMEQPGNSLPTAGNNPSYILSYNAAGYTVKIEETIGAITYTTNIVPQDSDTTITSTKSVSSWS